MIDYNKETREEYIKRLRSYENQSISFDQAKVILKDWIKQLEESAERLKVYEEYGEIARLAVDQQIYNEAKKIMLISLYGYDAFINVAKQIKEFEPETLLDVIEDILSNPNK